MLVYTVSHYWDLMIGQFKAYSYSVDMHINTVNCYFFNASTVPTVRNCGVISISILLNYGCLLANKSSKGFLCNHTKLKSWSHFSYYCINYLQNKIILRRKPSYYYNFRITFVRHALMNLISLNILHFQKIMQFWKCEGNHFIILIKHTHWTEN